MQNESEEMLLEALRSNKASAFEALYKKYYRMVVKQVTDFDRPAEEAEDLFQEMLIILVRKLRDENFVLTSKLSTYIFGIVRNMLLKKKGKKLMDLNEDLDEQKMFTDGDEVREKETLDVQLNLVIAALEVIEESCRLVLTLSFFEKRSGAEIAQQLDYTEAFVKVKKHRCLEYLRKTVLNNPAFKK
jgi:RNA polymerase sigma factor (sigma-70 family)